MIEATDGDVAPDVHVDSTCDLCEAARITPWFYEDDLCWIAECEFCAVPMVVLRHHVARPDETTRELLWRRLRDVVFNVAPDEGPFETSWWIDDNMRNVPDHYHAHARRRVRWSGG